MVPTRENPAHQISKSPQTILIDSLGLVLIVWSIPAAILLVGKPIVLVAQLVITLTRWILQL